MDLVGPIYSGAAVGADGSATASAATDHLIAGEVTAIYIEYLDSPPAGTTDVTVRTKGTAPAPPTQTLLAVANAATNGWFYPQVPLHLASTGAAIADSYGCPVIYDLIEVVIAQANAGDGVNVWLIIE